MGLHDAYLVVGGLHEDLAEYLQSVLVGDQRLLHREQQELAQTHFVVRVAFRLKQLFQHLRLALPQHIRSLPT
jgi:hypothetical protein